MRMSLDAVKGGLIKKPVALLLYAPEGVGKSSFGINMPNPIYISTEAGTNSLDVNRFPEAKTGTDIISAIDTLYREDHDYKTVILDTADWAEKLFMKDIAHEQQVDSFAKIGYGKGYEFLLEKFQIMLAGFNALRNEKGMHVVINAHAKISKFADPTGDPYDRYTIACHEKTVTPMLKEWADAVGFANFDKYTQKDGQGFNERTVAKGNGDRVIYFEHSPAHDAKSRFGHPVKTAFHKLFAHDFMATYDAFFEGGGNG